MYSSIATAWNASSRWAGSASLAPSTSYTLALTQFLMVLVLGIWYLRKADHEYDPLAQRVVTAAGGGDGGEAGRAAEGRFARRDSATAERTDTEVTR